MSRRHAQARASRRITVEVAPERTITLSAGGQNVLVERILREFLPRFTPGGEVVYVGDTDDKRRHFDDGAFGSLGVTIEPHGKMPDVVIHHRVKGWLVLIEAVTSHGPVDPLRRGALRELFRGSTAGLVFVTAFASRREMARYLDQISWETEVWIADAPDHLIHFDGERFLDPYEDGPAA